jgi:large subunit ribosomal protein L27Ae
MLSESAQQQYAKDKTKTPVIDVTKLGYHKVLGRGKLAGGVPVVVKAKFFSTKAQRRIRAAGGACVLTA